MSLMIAKRWVLRLVVFLLLGLITLSAQATVTERGEVTHIAADIAQLYPSATRVGIAVGEHKNVTPVFQLNELLGYTFETDDFTHIIGFSGQTINLLIAIDPLGTLIGLKVLRHHEPIFMHGLGEEPMVEFIDQYAGHSIKERFIIDARDRQREDATHFDGVTKATVSAMVINDTIITAALKMARSMLEGFAPLSNKKINHEFYSEQSFTQLVANGYIFHWKIERETLAAKMPFLEKQLEDANHSLNFVDLYIAPLSLPIVAKNLLSAPEYQRLVEDVGIDSNAFLILDLGGYSFVATDFVAQTAPERFKITQAGLPQDSRDIDFYSFLEPTFAIVLPEYQQLMVIHIKSQSGFDLAAAFNFSLSVDYGSSFLSRNSHEFTFKVKLPSAAFSENEVQHAQALIPLWQQIWRGRCSEIIILLIFLGMLTTVFIMPNGTSRLLVNRSGNSNYLRLACLLFCVAFIGVYAQGQLSVVNIYTLLLSVAEGFNVEVFLLDPMLFILWGFVFVSLFIWGRGLFCGWLCPFGALQELVTMLAKKLAIKPWRIAPRQHKMAQKIKYVLLLLLIGCAFYSLELAQQFAEVEPFKTAITMNFVRFWPFVLYAVLLTLISLKIHKFYCRYLCPLGAGLAILGAFPLVKWIRRRSECGSPCQLCKTKKCGVDAIERNGAINYRECVGCFDCVVTINQPTMCVIDKKQQKRRLLGKK